MLQHTPSCQIESKSNTIQGKAAPQSYQSIIWCNNGRQVYVDIYYSCIHKEGLQRGNEQIFPFLLFYFSLGGGGRNPVHLSLIHCAHTQTHNTHHEVSGFVHILTCRKPMSPALLAYKWERMNADNRRRVNGCTAVSFRGIIKDRRWQWWWLNTLGPNQVRCIILDALETVCVSAQHLAWIVFQS